MRVRETCLRVGNLVVSVQAEVGIDISGYVDSFVVDSPPEATIRVRSLLQIHSVGRRERLPVPGDEVSGAVDVRWRILGESDGESVVIHRTGLDLLVQYAADSSCDQVDVWLSGPQVADGARWSDRNLSLVEFLPLPAVVLLAGRQGLFLHSCAVTNRGEGILFAGVSGSGKSTMSELWRKFGPPTTSVIDDEHVIAQRVNGRMRLYGAPWKRGVREAANRNAPLKALFFLSHAAQNRCIPLSPGEAFVQLISQVFLPLWSREQVELSVQTCEDLVRGAECYHLEFVPGAGVVSFVQEVLEGLR